MTEPPAASISDSEATAHYIHDLVGELGRMAGEAGLDLLAYLLEMVRLEAKMVAQRGKATRISPDIV